jgi:hypothetical protein
MCKLWVSVHNQMSGDNSEPLLGDVESWGNQPTIEVK